MAESKQEERFAGSVKWFSSRKGFGFIAHRDGDKGDLFVHQSEIVSRGYRTLSDGDLVEFSVCKDSNGREMASEVVFRGRGSQAGPGPCYTCGQFGHFARDCTDLRSHLSNGGNNHNNGEQYVKRSEECYNCGRTGHFARDCMEGRRINGGNNGEYATRRNDKCFNCGKIGHFARDCRTAIKKN